MNQSMFSDLASKMGAAVFAGNAGEVASILDKHGNSLPMDDIGMALTYAAWFGHGPIVETVVNRYKESLSPLSVQFSLGSATMNNHRGVADFLLARYGDNLAAPALPLVLISAAETDNGPLLETVLHRYGNDMPEMDVGHALLSAAQGGHYAMVEFLADWYGESIPNNYVNNAYKLATKNGHTAVVESLLHHYGRVIPLLELGNSLERSAQEGHSELVETILNHVDDLITDPFKQNAYNLAELMGHSQCVEILNQGTFASRIAERLEQCPPYQSTTANKIRDFVKKAPVNAKSTILRALSDENEEAGARARAGALPRADVRAGAGADFLRRTGQFLTLMLKSRLPVDLTEHIFSLSKLEVDGIPLPIAAQVFKIRHSRRSPSISAEPAISVGTAISGEPSRICRNLQFTNQQHRTQSLPAITISPEPTL